jgi:hypothetical protein
LTGEEDVGCVEGKKSLLLGGKEEYDLAESSP